MVDDHIASLQEQITSLQEQIASLQEQKEEANLRFGPDQVGYK